MGIGDKLRGWVLEDDEEKPKPATSSTPVKTSLPPSDIPRTPTTYPSISSGGGQYYATLNSVLNAVQHPGNAFFVTAEKMRPKMPNDSDRFSLALDVSGVPKSQILEALAARENALKKEIETAARSFQTKWSAEIDTRDKRVMALTSQISSLQSQIAAAENEIATLTHEKEQRSVELTTNKSSFDFAAQTVAAELETLKQTITQYI